MECRHLYFLDGNNQLRKVRGPAVPRKSIDKVIERDLKKRKPDFVSYYKRYCETDDGGLLIDFGSHYEFYIWR